MKHIGKWVIAFPRATIGITIALTLFFAYFIPQIKINNDSGDFIPTFDNERIYDERIQEIFGNDDIIYIGFVVTDSIYTPHRLAKVAKLSSLLQEVEGVVKVDSLSTLKNISGTADGMDVSPFVDEENLPQTPEDCDAVRAQIENWDVLVNNLVSQDGKATSMVVKLEPNVGIPEQEKVYKSVKKIIDANTDSGESFHYSGGTSINVLLGEYMLSDTKRLLPIAFLVVSLFLWLSFRTINGVVLPLVNVGLSIIWTIGCMSLFDVPLSLTCSAIPVILVAVGTAYAIHIVNDYYAEVKANVSKDEMFMHCFEKIGIAVIMAGLTTVAGFATLSTNAVVPVRQFGIFAGFGTFVALVLAFTFVPAILYLQNPPARKESSTSEENAASFVGNYRKAQVSFALNHKWQIVAVGVVILLLAAWGTSQVFVDDNGIAYFKEGTKMREDDAVLGKYFGGTHLCSVIIAGPATYKVTPTMLEKLRAQDLPETHQLAPNLLAGLQALENQEFAKKEDFLNALAAKLGAENATRYEEVILGYATAFEQDAMKEPIVLRNMEGLQQHLQKTFPFIGKTMSLADYIKKMNMALNEDSQAAYQLPDPSDPEGKNLVAQYLLLYENSGDPKDFEHVVDYDYAQARMVILSKVGSTLKTNEIVKEIYAYVAKNFDKRYTARVTGAMYTPIIMDKYVVSGQVTSIISSILAVWVLCAIIFRSAVGGTVTIIPLSMSVLISFASMGFLKIPLEIGTSIVANAAVGIGVDYAIHFLTRFRYEMAANKLPPTTEGFFQASVLTAMTSGQAILFNAVSVAAGFLVMIFSSFMPLVRLGALVAAVMFTSSIGSMIFLPVVLSIFKPKFITKPAGDLGI